MSNILYPFCRDCKWFNPNNTNCRHPTNNSIVTGFLIDTPAQAYRGLTTSSEELVRWRPYSICGITGQYYEHKWKQNNGE